MVINANSAKHIWSRYHCLTAQSPRNLLHTHTRCKPKCIVVYFPFSNLQHIVLWQMVLSKSRWGMGSICKQPLAFFFLHGNINLSPCKEKYSSLNVRLNGWIYCKESNTAARVKVQLVVVLVDAVWAPIFQVWNSFFFRLCRVPVLLGS